MPDNSLSNLSLDQLRRAVSIKERIEGLQTELATLLGKPAGLVRVAAASGADPRKGQKRSAAARARMAAAQKARWAKVNKGATPAKAAKPAPKRKISAAGLARISAAAKARWAKVKAAGKTRLG